MREYSVLFIDLNICIHKNVKNIIPESFTQSIESDKHAKTEHKVKMLLP